MNWIELQKVRICNKQTHKNNNFTDLIDRLYKLRSITNIVSLTHTSNKETYDTIVKRKAVKFWDIETNFSSSCMQKNLIAMNVKP